MGPTPGIYARNCSVRRIDRRTAAEFINANHRLGDTGSRYRYGLFVERSTGASEFVCPPGTLVAVASFSNARRWLKGERKVSSYEWIRYASLSGVRVVGGMSKLLRTFIEEIGPDDIMSYADADCGDGGESYRKLGFEQEGVVEREGFRNLKFRLTLTRR